MRLYTDKHEWIEIDKTIGTVGISEYAQVRIKFFIYIKDPLIKHYSVFLKG